jgi:hypothetical protein
MIQIIRAFIRHEVIEAGPGVGVGEVGGNALRLVYAADTVYDLAFTQMLEEIRSKYVRPIQEVDLVILGLMRPTAG